MRVYVATRFKGSDNKQAAEALCKAVHDAKLKDFCLVRDVSDYDQLLENRTKLWDRVRDEIGASDMLLVDVTEPPTAERVAEASIAYAMRKSVIVTKKQGIDHKGAFDGIASIVITYKNHADLSRQLNRYDIDRNYNTTDKTMLFIMFLMVGGIIAWGLWQIFPLLAFGGALLYWLAVRHFSPTMRAFDRVVVYIPLTLAWWPVFLFLNEINLMYGVGWTLGFWLVALLILRKMKISL